MDWEIILYTVILIAFSIDNLLTKMKRRKRIKEMVEMIESGTLPSDIDFLKEDNDPLNRMLRIINRLLVAMVWFSLVIKLIVKFYLVG